MASFFKFLEKVNFFACVAEKRESIYYLLSPPKAPNVMKSVFENKKTRALDSGSAEPIFALIGGFLGAGKTTLIGALTVWLRKRGATVALVTND